MSKEKHRFFLLSFNSPEMNYSSISKLRPSAIAYPFSVIFFFLDAFSHLYERVCPSVRPSVCSSVGRPYFSRIIDFCVLFFFAMTK